MMRSLIFAAAALLVLLAGLPIPGAEAIRTIRISVRETAGLRRFGYPVSVVVPLPRGAVSDAGMSNNSPSGRMPAAVDNAKLPDARASRSTSSR